MTTDLFVRIDELGAELRVLASEMREAVASCSDSLPGAARSAQQMRVQLCEARMLGIAIELRAIAVGNQHA